MCEVNESSICSDCGPFTLKTAAVGGIYSLPGVMVDIRALTDIVLNSLTFETRSAAVDVTLYTASGSYNDKAENADAWTEIASESKTTTRELFNVELQSFM